MKENVNEFLGISPGEETKTEKCVQNTNLVNPRDKAEHTLIKVAKLVLIVGILATIFCLFTIVLVKNPEYYSAYSSEKYIFSPNGFITTIAILLSSVISWSFMTVVANISLTLKDINKTVNK